MWLYASFNISVKLQKESSHLPLVRHMRNTRALLVNYLQSTPALHDLTLSGPDIIRHFHNVMNIWTDKRRKWRKIKCSKKTKCNTNITLLTNQIGLPCYLSTLLVLLQSQIKPAICSVGNLGGKTMILLMKLLDRIASAFGAMQHRLHMMSVINKKSLLPHQPMRI